MPVYLSDDVICQEDEDILMADIYKNTFNIRSPLLKTLDWGVETLGPEYISMGLWINF